MEAIKEDLDQYNPMNNSNKDKECAKDIRSESKEGISEKSKEDNNNKEQSKESKSEENDVQEDNKISDAINSTIEDKQNNCKLSSGNFKVKIYRRK